MPQPVDDLQNKLTERRKRGSKVGSCAYCGEIAELTRDHVIPKCLFRDKRNSKIIVRACQPCNVAKSETEDDLRDFLALTFRSENHPNQNILLEKAGRSARKNRSPTLRRARWTMRSRTYPVAGKFREFVTMSADPGPMLDCVDYIARGLYAHVTKRPCDAMVEVQSRYLGTFAEDPLTPFMEAFQSNPIFRVVDQESVLEAFFWPEMDGEQVVLYMGMSFLGGSNFIAYVDPTVAGGEEAFPNLPDPM